MKQIKIKDLTAFTAGNKKNPPIIFIHGFPYDHSLWNFQIERLKDDFFCVAYDVRGLGKSRVGDGQYVMEMFVQDLFNIITKLKLKKPILCGHSMGGYIALRAVELERRFFSGLILCNTRASADDDLGKLKRQNSIMAIDKSGAKKFIKKFAPLCFGEETIKENNKLFKKVLQTALKSKPKGVKGCQFAMLSRTDSNQFLSNLSVPVLVISGTVDNLTPPEMMREFSEKIPNSEFAVAPRAGHMAPVENPGFVNDIIEDFLKRRICLID